MDRDYFLVSFVIAAAVATAVARVTVSRIDGWQLLREAADDPRAKLLVLAAVAVLLWVTAALLTQIVSGASLALSQWFLNVDDFFERGRIRAISINSGISSGLQVGLALGLIEYVVRALADVRTLTANEAEPPDDEDTGWLGPSDE